MVDWDKLVGCSAELFTVLCTWPLFQPLLLCFAVSLFIYLFNIEIVSGISLLSYMRQS